MMTFAGMHRRTFDVIAARSPLQPLEARAGNVLQASASASLSINARTRRGCAARPG